MHLSEDSISINSKKQEEWSQDGRGIGWGDHFLHQKFIKMLSNFYKTTSEHWWSTPGTQKGSPFSSKGGRTKHKRKRQTKELRMETHPGEGVMKEKLPNSRKPCHRWVYGKFWNLRGQHNQEKNK